MIAKVGTAGWSIPPAERSAFPQDGSHLERYAAVFNAVEINSSFYRSHRRITYERWAASVGDEFRFSIKLPRSISHAGAGRLGREEVERFASEVVGLGNKLSVVLVQFPPGRIFRADEAAALFETLSALLPTHLACEPRHSSWFTNDAERLLEGHRVARVGADPPRATGADIPAGWPGLRYFRLHGSPRIYYSRYEPAALEALGLAVQTGTADSDVWCIFDNTALGAATSNALEAARLMKVNTAET